MEGCPLTYAIFTQVAAPALPPSRQNQRVAICSPWDGLSTSRSPARPARSVGVANGDFSGSRWIVPAWSLAKYPPLLSALEPATPTPLDEPPLIPAAEFEAPTTPGKSFEVPKTPKLLLPNPAMPTPATVSSS